MILTKEELIKEAKDCADVEIYYSTNDSLHTFHTDYIRNASVDEADDINDLPNEFEGKYFKMQESDYNATILANTCEYANFADWYGDKDAQVLCILVY